MPESLFNNSEVFMGDFVDAEEIFGEDTSENKEEKNPDETTGNPKENENLPEGEVTAEDLFGDNNPESVGDDNNNEENEETSANKGTGSSPEGSNPYSSFAQALYSGGLFQFLDEDTVNGVIDAETFSDAFENEINARLDDETRRVKEALELGLKPSVVAQYENTIKRLEDISDEALEAETEEGSNLRRIIIKQDYITKGFSPERAEKQVDRIMSSGTDIEDAKDSLESVTKFFKAKYDETIEAEREKVRAEEERIKKESLELKKTILDSKTLFEDIPIDKPTRQKAYDAITKVVKTTKDGEKLTAIQLYADEHPIEFRVMLGTVYSLTDGFTKMGNLLKNSVNNKVKRNLQEIERRIQGEHQGGSFRSSEGDYTDDYTRSSGRKRLDID